MVMADAVMLVLSMPIMAIGVVMVMVGMVRLVRHVIAPLDGSRSSIVTSDHIRRMDADIAEHIREPPEEEAEPRLPGLWLFPSGAFEQPFVVCTAC